MDSGPEGNPFVGEGEVYFRSDEIVQDFLALFVKNGAKALFILVLTAEAGVVAFLLGQEYTDQVFLGIAVECVYCIGHKYQLHKRKFLTYLLYTLEIYVSRGRMEMYGERMKLLRKTRKVPQKELAELMGVKIRGYQFYESETTEPTISALIALADFYGVSIDYLVGRTDTP